MSDLVADVDLLLVDVWGVLHNGLAIHPAAADALTRYRAQGGFVILLSNAARPSHLVIEILNRLGAPHEAYDGLVTSGDMSRSLLARSDYETLAFFGPDANRAIFAGLPLRETAIADADILLCAGLDDDEKETPGDYADRLKACRARGLPMICANPDLQAERGPKLVWCAGAIAEAYAQLGGDVTWTGKPHRPIYDAAIDMAELSLGRRLTMDRVLTIGDAIRTDIAGAAAIGARSLFIAGGLHARELANDSGAIDRSKTEAFLQAAAFQPTAVADYLRW